jgi:xylan 1,4-beta-xylosidase
MGPWLANNIRECEGLSQTMSYWTFSDVFEEQGVVKMPFYGGYGLIAERGIPKPAFVAFQLLHQLGNKRLALESENALATVRDDGAIALALWNYAEPGETVSPRTFHLDIKGSDAKHYRMQFVDPDHASSLKVWKEIGSPQWPSLDQIRRMKDAAELGVTIEGPISAPITVAPQGLVLLSLIP